MAFTCFLMVALVIYSLLESVHHTVAVAMVVINAISVAISSINMVNHGARDVVSAQSPCNSMSCGGFSLAEPETQVG